MDIYVWILIAFGIVSFLSFVLYIPKFIQMTYCFQKPERRVAKEKRKLSVIIPARDESNIIGELFDSILKQDYDREYYDLTVIVQDEKDPTLRMAKKLGAKTLVVPEQKSKSDALDGYFQSLSDKKRDSYAAFVIIDADDILAPDYFTELNNALEYDCQIFTTRKNIKNFLGGKEMRSAVCGCTALTYPMLDEMGNYYRMKKGIPLNFCGQGMMIRSEVIRELGGWPYHTMTEDYEMKPDSVLHGFTSMYYPYAALYTEEVIRHRDAWARRLRWLMGHTQSDRKYGKQVRKKIKEDKLGFLMRYEYFYSLIPLLLFIAADLLTALSGIGLTVYYAVVNGPWLSCLFVLTVFPLLYMYVLDFLYKTLVMISYEGGFKGVPLGERILTLLYCPIYDLEYVALYIHALVSLLLHRNTEWRHTRRVPLSGQEEPPQPKEKTPEKTKKTA